jgi:TolB-like protein/DNA-binding winged helix-turn-helix (wHTH) protein/Tfp pilus assembly protein PilF
LASPGVPTPMKESNARPHLLRFGVFEVNLRTGELRKQGLKLKLCGQPFQVLALLLERPGELVTREEIREKLWPGDTFVDFEHSVNSLIKRLREVLGDDPLAPRFIETLPRHGYRFIAPVETVAPVSPPATSVAALYERRHLEEAEPAVVDRRYSVRARTLALAVGGLVTLVAVLVGLNIAGLRERVLRALGAAREPPLQIRSIAVLPLENLSGDPQQDYFADGMTEELITNLGKISSLRVISRTSVMRYKGTKKPLPEIAKELNVDALVEGTVLRSGDRVRITANLLHAKTDRHLWSETYERDLGDILTLQDEVAQDIAKEIQIKVKPQEQARLASTRPVNPAAHEAYLKGQFFFNKLTKEDLLKAIEYAQQAIQIDPDYAAAYGLLASSYWESSVTGFGDLPNREAAQKTRAAAMKALELDDTLAEAHVGLGSVLDRNDWDWAGAEREFKRAIELNPSFGRAHAMYAFDLMLVGRGAESIREAKRALELDPFSAHSYLTITLMYYYNLRQYDQSLEYARKWLEMFPNNPGGYDWLANNLVAKGLYDEAIEARKKYMALRGEKPEDIAALGRAYEVGGIRGVWRWELERAKERSARAEVSPEYFANRYARLGEKDKAFEWLEKGYQQRDHEMAFVRGHPAYDKLRSDPRFQDLLRRMNFPP